MYEGAEVGSSTNAQARTYKFVRTSFCISAQASTLVHTSSGVLARGLMHELVPDAWEIRHQTAYFKIRRRAAKEMSRFQRGMPFYKYLLDSDSFHAHILIAWLTDEDSLRCYIVTTGRQIAKMFYTFSL